MAEQTQQPGQSPLQDYMNMDTAKPEDKQPQSLSSPPPNSPEKQPISVIVPVQRCRCQYFRSRGLGCPCSVLYAIKVGRKATERILSKSTFFPDSESNVSIVNEKQRASGLDESEHSSGNRILQLEPQSLELGKELGKGGFCVVYEANLSLPPHLLRSGTTSNDEFEQDHDKNDNEYEYCVKFLKPNVLPERKKFARGIADLAIEAHFLASLNHPHILHLRGVSQSFKLFEPTSPLFLSDLSNQPGLEGGSFLLLDKLKMTLDVKINHWKELQQKWTSFLNRTLHDIRGAKRREFRLERVTVALQLASAMQYLHNHNICYRDLKPDNIGFDYNNSLKLFDFGLAKELKEYKRHSDGTYQLTGNTGSKRYMAPEVAMSARYNLKVDVFSYGILFWEMCALEKPFDGFTEVQHRNFVVERGHRPNLNVLKNWPQSVKHIISRCWLSISNERPDFRQIVNALIQVRNEMRELS